MSVQEAFEALEPDDGKLSRPVLRGPGLSNGVRPLDRSDMKSPDHLAWSPLTAIRQSVLNFGTEVNDH